MKVLIVTPAPPRSRKGNRVTALRWSRFLRRLGHRVTLAESFHDQTADVLVALHARKSARSVRRFRRRRPGQPLILALTGTDLYDDIHHSAAARESLKLADRLILLQPHGRRELPRELHHKVRVIHQSVSPPRTVPPPLKSVFEVCVVGHLRTVKDPFRTALAARRLPPASRIRVIQIGGALTPAMERRAHSEMSANPRYRWLGELPRWRAMRRLARSRLLVLTSKLEGGANVISEAVAASVPVVSSRICGSLGLLGEDYPGYFETGDTQGLCNLLWRAESDAKFLTKLRSHCRRLRPLFQPAREQRSWKALLQEFGNI